MNEATVLLWHQALRDVRDDEGMEAFGEMTRMSIIGDWMPSHVFEALKVVRQRRADAELGKWPKVSEAPQFFGTVDLENPSPEYTEWLRIERAKLYRAKGVREDNQTYLVMNPAAWPWKLDEHGRAIFFRPAPQPTGIDWTDGKPVEVKRTRRAA